MFTLQKLNQHFTLLFKTCILSFGQQRPPKMVAKGLKLRVKNANTNARPNFIQICYKLFFSFVGLNCKFKKNGGKAMMSFLSIWSHSE